MVRNVQDLSTGVRITMNGSIEEIAQLQIELNQALSDLELTGQIEIQKG
jgi:hypothetical protein